MSVLKIMERRAQGAFRESSPRSGRREATIIKAGWGSSGYYSEEVLAESGPKAWPEGTRMFLNHPTINEEIQRPERDVKDWVGNIATNPRMAGIELASEAEVFDHWKPVINSIADKVGLSVMAPAIMEHGAAGGKEGPIVKEIMAHPMNEVDYVTVAGAGGKLGTLIESAREGGHGLPEHPTDEDIEELLREVSDDKLQVFIAQATSLKESRSTSSGGNQTKEQEMEKEELQRQLSEAQTKLTEAEKSAEESDTKLKEAVKERDEANDKAERASDALLAVGAKSIAREVADSIEGMPSRAQERVVRESTRDVPRTEDGKLDEEKVRENAKKAARAELEYLADQEIDGDLPIREAGNEGSAATRTTTTKSGDDAAIEKLEESFRASGMSEEAAKTAARGR